jgi:hypothetical protein
MDITVLGSSTVPYPAGFVPANKINWLQQPVWLRVRKTVRPETRARTP